MQRYVGNMAVELEACGEFVGDVIAHIVEESV